MTRLSRRDFTKVLVGGVAASMVMPRLSEADQITRLVARRAGAQLAPSTYPETEIWGFGGTVPGPVIRVGQGASLSRRFVNRLPQASSIHWHGMRITNAMDGVPGVTQEAVRPNGEFLYQFTVPDAGTYCITRTTERGNKWRVASTALWSWTKKKELQRSTPTRFC